MEGKPAARSEPMPDYSILLLSDRLKQMPEEIEQMDAYWFNRWMKFIEAENIVNKRQAAELQRSARKGR